MMRRLALSLFLIFIGLCFQTRAHAQTEAKQVAQGLQACLAARDGGSHSGGGDFYSQMLAQAIHGLPAVLKARGMEKFPEVSLDALNAKISDPELRVEKSDGPIFINGAPKDARNYPDLKFVLEDSDALAKMLKLPNADEKLNGLAFHEVLGLMELEGNDDYHISSRLPLSANKSTECSSSKFEIPAGAPNVLYIRISYDLRPTYSHCVRYLGTMSMTDESCSESFAAQAVNEPGQFERVSATGEFAFAPVSSEVQKGAQVEKGGVNDGGDGGIKQTYGLPGAYLRIWWGRKVKNSLGETLATAEYQSIIDGQKGKTALYCKIK